MPNVGTLYTGVRGVASAIKDAGRMREIAAVLVKHGFGAVVTRLGLEDTAGVKNLMDYRSGQDAPLTLARRIRMAVEELGPTYVKLGQILSTRPDIVPADVCAELQHLQDDVPPMAWDDVQAQVLAELGVPLQEAFASFEQEPLACASIAQVHRAVLKTGEQAVVKVQRPAIAGRIDADLHILRFLARQIERNLPDLALMDPVGIVREFERAIRKELDFRNERRNIKQFELNFRDFEGLRVPAVYEDFCTPKLLAMELIDGVKITRALELLDVDPYVVAPRMLRALFKMVFEDGVFHGDLHPGNILIMPDSEIVLIDFGLVGRLTDEQRDNILDVLVGLSRSDYNLIARVFFDIGVKQPGVVYDFARFEADVIEVVEQHVEGRKLAEIDVGAFFGDLVSGAIRHKIKMPPTYTMVFKALMTIEGIGKTLAPELNFIEEARPFVQDMLLRRYSPERLMKVSVDALGNLSRFLRRTPRLATRLLEDISEGRASVRMQLVGLDTLIATQRKSHARHGRAIILASCVLGGALALGAPGPTLFGMNVVSEVLFVIAGLLGFRLFIGGLRGV